MNKMIKKGLLTLSAAAALSIAIVPGVFARSFGCADGAQLAHADSVCFDRANGLVTNICSTTKTYEVQLLADTAGTKNVSFSGKNGVSCSPAATDALNGSFSNAPAGVASTAAFINVPLGAVSLASGGKLWLHCDISPNATLATVNYNP